jgi:hypothetical protein
MVKIEAMFTLEQTTKAPMGNISKCKGNPVTTPGGPIG